jgi:hypothetical protein
MTPNVTSVIEEIEDIHWHCGRVKLMLQMSSNEDVEAIAQYLHNNLIGSHINRLGEMVKDLSGAAQKRQQQQKVGTHK